MFGSKATKRVEQLEAVMAAIARSHAVVELSLDGNVTSVNDVFLHVTGYLRDDIVGRPYATFLTVAEWEAAERRQFWASLQRGEICSGEFRCRGRAGREVWLQAAYNQVTDGSGAASKVVGVATDVTGTRTQRAHAAGQFDAVRSSLALAEFDVNGTILATNDHLSELMGYTPAELAGQHHRVLVVASERDAGEEGALWPRLARGESVTGVFRRVTKARGEVWMQATYAPALGVDGKLSRVVCIGSDVTAQNLADGDRKGQLDAIHRSQAVIEFELDGTIRAANANFLAATGYALAEIVGRHHAIFVDPALRETPAYRAFWHALSHGEFKAGEFKRFRKDGRPIWLQASYNAIFGLDGKPFKVVKFATDVSAQAAAREEFDSLIENVAAAAHELSSSITEISTTMQRSQETASEAVQRVAVADGSTQRLNAAAHAMGRVVDMIGNITGQINLLALNATIESARAGEAGRGFAVVASEVKNLANRARAATDEIAGEIDAIRAVSHDVVETLAAIRQAIDGVSAFVTSTAAAVEQQSAATETISANMQTAAMRAQSLRAA